jgi:anthranilate synthase component 1
MYTPSLKEFLKLSEKGSVIPVYKEISADLDTPVSCFLKIKKSDCAFLLESVEGQEKIARYSFLGSQPSLIFQSKGKNIQITYSANTEKRFTRRFVTQRTPLDEIKKMMQDFKPVEIEGLPRFYGGMVGYMGYDMVRFFEKIPDKNPDDLKLPDAIFILADSLLVFDHVNHTIKIVYNATLPKIKRLPKIKKIRIYQMAIKNIESIHSALKQPLKEKKQNLDSQKRPKIVSNFKKAEFQNIVKKALEFIKRGDIIQAVLSQRFKVKIDKEPFDIYRNLRSLNPSPYMFFLKLKNVELIGSSPEMLVRCEEGIVQTRPIAGTRPRGKTEAEDKRLEHELLNSSKEKAEHIMLVDLGRNDLGRVCQPGKIELSEFMTVERYSHVMHLVTEVRGILDKKYNIYDVLRAGFPAGTVTGSPKIRAMEIIDELENLRRGPYAGCVGYFSFSQNLDTCITIRTIVVKDNSAYIQAGAGIVADSCPEKEYFESVNKAKALIEAIIK